MKITQKIVNLETGEETITEIDETPSDKKARENAEKAFLAAKTENEEKAIEKSALLKKLGITDDEAKLLLS